MTHIADEFAIQAVRPVLAFDSRGTPTISCEVMLRGGAVGAAIVPSGASTGTFEAVERRDGDAAFGGRGVTQAIAGITQEIAPAIHGLDARDQLHLDTTMVALDAQAGQAGQAGRLARLGGNAVLSVSVATALAAAAQSRMAAYEYWAQGSQPLIPLPMVNIFSGGAHATAALDVQDLLIVPIASQSFTEGISWVWEVRQAVARLLTAKGLNAQLVADEGGFGVAFADTREGLAVIVAGIEAVGLVPGQDIAIAMDVAASELYHGGRYELAQENRTLNRDEFIAELAQWVADFPIASIEDPLDEQDWDGHHQAARTLEGVQVVGDDLFVTDLQRLNRGIDQDAASAVLVKPNQAGTLSAAHEVVAAAQRRGFATILSARSGESEDSWLADLAVGWRTGQIKVGSLTRSERTAKWNRLLRIEHELGSDATYAGGAALVSPRQLRPWTATPVPSGGPR